jgi:cytochrome c oxidase subunit I+III
VTSRHPLWDQERIDAGDPDQERLVQSLARWPLRWRAAMIVSTGDATPQEIFRVADPSIWPLVAALGTVGVFASELLKLRLGIAASVAVIVGAVIMWNRPSPPPMSREEELAFESANHVPVRASGSIVIAQWATGLAVLFLAIALGSFLLAYFYLRLENPTWPPPDADLPSPVLTLTAVALAGAATAAVNWGRRAGRSDDRPGLLLGLAGSVAAGCAAATALALDLGGANFRPQDHSYGSIVFTLGGFGLVVLVGAVIMSATVLMYAVRGSYGPSRLSPVDNVGRFWMAAAVIWTVSLATVALGPRLT